MGAALYLLAGLVLAPAVQAESGRLAPSYSAASIVNSASNMPGALAPYTIASLYGSDLAYTTRAISGEDIRGGRLPTELAGVRVYLGGFAAALYFVSPGQINLLVPTLLRGKEVELQVTLDSRAGPPVNIQLLDAAPALFQADSRMVVAVRADWSAVTEEAPLLPGEDVILFATGLGATTPDVDYPQTPRGAAPIKRLAEFRVLLDGVAVDSGRIAYAGIAPGFAGLYQINLKLPESLADDPEVRIALGNQISPEGLRLPVRDPASAQQFSPPPRLIRVGR
jgi:uncharacterized protein (TIGR03437 family)